MKYTCINIQGNLISEEILQKIEKGEAQGQSAIDFGFEPDANLRNEIEYAWSRIRLDWKNFSEKGQKLQATDTYGTTLSRRWMEQFLGSIGFELSRMKSALEGNNHQSYSISHTADNLDHVPVHLVGFIEPTNPDKNTLDIKTSGGTTRFSPHGTVQEYLNVTEYIYGVAANGLFLRLIRDSGRLIKLTYVEFDIKRMLEEDKYSEFNLLYRLLHASRFPRNKAESEQCLMEKYYQDSIETGNRIRDGLSNAVKHSLEALGNGFLQHEQNDTLRAKIRSGTLSHKDYYRQLLRIIYRFLFLMVTEERDLIYDPEDKNELTLRKKSIYLQYYSIARLRRLSQNRYVYERQFTDLWTGLLHTFLLFEAGGNGGHLQIQPLDGNLFSAGAIVDLNDSIINNKLLLECVKNLNEFRDDQNNLVQINYRSLDVEELGSVYEGLLDLHPVIENVHSSNPAYIEFRFLGGTDRKTSGSYYTRPELVNELIKSALIPVIEQRLRQHAGDKNEQVKALLKLKVCDPAAGSGHMLLAAARTIAWYLGRVQSGDENPAPAVYRKCLREVIQHCIYAVDFNPAAVELCKLALWLEGHNSGKPLSFLDHKIRNGNSLVGVSDLSVLESPIPDMAFSAITGDNIEVCKDLKKRNATYRKTKQTNLFSALEQKIEQDKKMLNSSFAAMELIEQDTLEAVHEVQTRFDSVRKSVDRERQACNIWTAAFFKTYENLDDPTNPASEKLDQFFVTPAAYDNLIVNADALSAKYKFFHWPLEFPDVYEQGGFDAMLGNPPWERIKLQEQEFFKTRNSEIATAANKSARDKLIKSLPQTDPVLFKEYQETLHNADALGKFVRNSNRFPLTSSGDINTYVIFTELFTSFVNRDGMAGIIIPTGISSDNTTKEYFSFLVDDDRIEQLIGFENEELIFQEVHHAYKFCALTLSGKAKKFRKARFTFFHRNFTQLQNDLRYFELSKDDFNILNPNTKTCPIFRTRVDASLTTKLYKQAPVLIDELTGINGWGVTFMSMFHMSNDSSLFKTKDQLLSDGFEFLGNKLENGDESWLPLMEAKLTHQFNPRFATFEGAANRDETNTVDEVMLNDPLYSTQSWYYVKKDEVLDRIAHFDKPYLLGFRDVTNATNERTTIFSVLPFSASTGINLVFLDAPAIDALLFVCNWNSIVFDFVTRQKIGGMHLSQNYTKQFPVLLASQYKDKRSRIIALGFELSYNSWDIKSFADCVWNDADESLKAVIKEQWIENKAVTGGTNTNVPEWLANDNTSCPLAPFKWDENRRAKIKAELDAIYAQLYTLTKGELQYILDPQEIYGTDFPGETFRVLRDKDTRLYGEFRTKRLVLEAWEKLNNNEQNFVSSTTFSQPMREFSLNEGIYSVIDVARITHLTAEKIRRWFKDLSKVSYEGLSSGQQQDLEKMRISFHGLVELVVIDTLRENGFTLSKILKARADLKTKTGKLYPFATNNVKDNLKKAGSALIFRFPSGDVTLDGSGLYNLSFIEQFFDYIEFDTEGLALKIFPLKNSRTIVIDPRQGGGKAVISNKGVWAESVKLAYNGEESIGVIQEQYDLTKEEISAALEFYN
jgi:uncharacterized protein (DUF433 family)